MAKRSRKIDTTADTGGDRRRPDPDRVAAREQIVTGGGSDGDRSAGRKSAAMKPVRGMRVRGDEEDTDG